MTQETSLHWFAFAALVVIMTFWARADTLNIASSMSNKGPGIRMMDFSWIGKAKKTRYICFAIQDNSSTPK